VSARVDVEASRAVCEECDWAGRVGSHPGWSASKHNAQEHPEVYAAERKRKTEAQRQAAADREAEQRKRAAEEREAARQAKGPEHAAQLPGEERWQVRVEREQAARRAAAAQGRADNREIERQLRAERQADENRPRTRVQSRHRNAARSTPPPPRDDRAKLTPPPGGLAPAPRQPKGRGANTRGYQGAHVPRIPGGVVPSAEDRSSEVDRFPRTAPAKARQLATGDVLVIERGVPLSVLEVQPAKGSGLLVARVRPVGAEAGSRTFYVGPFLPDQIVQRAVRR
jgi:hypothetical protein